MPPLQCNGPLELVPVVLWMELGEVSEMRAGGLIPIKQSRAGRSRYTPRQVRLQMVRLMKWPPAVPREVATVRRGPQPPAQWEDGGRIGWGMPPPFKTLIPGSLPLNTLTHSQPQFPSCHLASKSQVVWLGLPPWLASSHPEVQLQMLMGPVLSREGRV